jgi:hypothetical protein
MVRPRPRYEIRVRGLVDPDQLVISDEVAVTVAAGVIRMTGPLDQAALHGLLQRIESLGLEVLEVRRLRPGGLPDT